MNPGTRNPLLYPRPRPVNLTAGTARQLLPPTRSNTTVAREAVHGRPVGDIETSGTVPITETSLEPYSDRAGDDTEARVPSRRQPRERVLELFEDFCVSPVERKEDIRELIGAAAIIGATILALRLYAAIASPSLW